MATDWMLVDDLEYPFFLWGRQITSHLQAREIVNANAPHLIDTFDALFRIRPSVICLPPCVANADALDTVDVSTPKEDFRKYKKKHPEMFNNPNDYDLEGSIIMVALLVKHDELTAEMLRVSCSSARRLTKQESSSTSPTPDDLTTVMEAFQDGFSQSYIDPFGYIQKTHERLVQNMDEYQRQSNGVYIAPYTSLVTSSMMGKSRLMKELTKKGPLVCLFPREIYIQISACHGRSFELV